MCGIFGYISNHQPITARQLEACTDALAHRGPDAGGYQLLQEGRVGLGHRRLSIIDLTDAAAQPMRSHCGRYWLVFNGELYNYREVGKKLVQLGALATVPHSDSRVLVEAFTYWGIDCVHEFNGMFAFGIYDTLEESMWLCRDRMGVKPLYYFADERRLVFASELKAILHGPGVVARPDKAALAAFLHLGYVPAPLSAYRGIRKLPTGHFLKLDKSFGVAIKPFWELAGQFGTEETPQDQPLAILERLLEDAVRLRLVSDVPLGTFLSGGIDSSLVTAIAQKLTPQPIKTFNIGFEEQKFDERKYAAQVARHLQTDHTSVVLREREAIYMIENQLRLFDEPFSDTSAIPTTLVSRLAVADVKVILTGDGGDELFMGYGAYDWAARLANPAFRWAGKLAAWPLAQMGGSRMCRIAKLLDTPANGRLHSHIFSQEQYLFAQREIEKLMPLHRLPQFHYQPTAAKPLRPAESQAFFDMQYYLPDDLLTKVDRASMYCGLECRVPLLDYRLVRFALNLDMQYKKQGSHTKVLMKELLYKHVPASLFDRPKWGFGIPLGKWLKGDLHFLVADTLSDQAIDGVGIFDKAYVKHLMTKWMAGDDYLYNRIWQLILTQQWMQRNGFTADDL